MNERQRVAIESCMEELTDALLVDLFLTHLVRQRIFSKSEMQIVRRQNVSDEMILMETFAVLKHKIGAWDCLVAFLNDNLFGQIAEKLANMTTSATAHNNVDAVVQQADLPQIGPTATLVEDFNQLAVSSEPAYVERYASLEVLNMPLFDTDEETDNDPLSLSSLTDQFYTTSSSELLPEVIKLMRINADNVEVLKSCRRLIDQYTCGQLGQLESPLRQSLIEVLLSVVKLHCHQSLIVERFADLLVKINVDQSEIDLNLDEIDYLLEIICDEKKLTTAAIKSTLRLMGKIARESDENQRNLIGQMGLVEVNCRSIRLQLAKSKYDDIMEINWECLTYTCDDSVANMKRFLDADGISLFQQCYKKFNYQIHLIRNMTLIMSDLSKEESFCDDLMANGNLAILWKIWGETKDKLTRSYCSNIFTNFLSVSPTSWPLGHPTIEEIKKALKDETKCLLM